VRTRCLLEVSIDLLNQDGFGLSVVSIVDDFVVRLHTCMLAAQRAVMLVTLDPETPGGLRLSMDCRIASSSATADDIG
jgi:hypothetical protein